MSAGGEPAGAQASRPGTAGQSTGWAGTYRSTCRARVPSSTQETWKRSWFTRYMKSWPVSRQRQSY
ncbi:MAG: hypothetical protein ACK559_33430, partial [bacterium]